MRHLPRYAALLLLAQAAVLGVLRDGLGFPDGHLTELDRFRHGLYAAGVVASGLGAVACWRARPALAAGLCALILALVWGASLGAWLVLENGQGG